MKTGPQQRRRQDEARAHGRSSSGLKDLADFADSELNHTASATDKHHFPPRAVRKLARDCSA